LTLPARAIWNRIRAFTPWPGAFTFQGAAAGERLIKIWSATVEEQCQGSPGTIVSADKSGVVVACGAQALRILELQREGGRRLGTSEYLAGHPIAAGEHFSTGPVATM
jgi:methionyl-tRNA formyltransferase